MEVDETIHRFQSTGILLTQPRQTMELEVNGEIMTLDYAEWGAQRDFTYRITNPIPLGVGIIEQMQNAGNRVVYSTAAADSLRWDDLPSTTSSPFTIELNSRFYNNLLFEDNEIRDLNTGYITAVDPYDTLIYGTGEPHQEEAKRKETPNFLKMIKTK